MEAGDAMTAWVELIGALRKGAMLTDAATWKERQVLINAVVGLLASGYAVARSQGWLAIEVEHAALVDLGTGLGAALFAGYNILATVVTTEKIGLSPHALPPGPSLEKGAESSAGPVPAAGDGLLEPARPADAGAVPPDARGGRRRARPEPPNPFLDN